MSFLNCMIHFSNGHCVGFKTATKACCGNGGQFAGIVPCGPTSEYVQGKGQVCVLGSLPSE
ncbi:hypothetical protein Bca4012_082803 [Brassica carinata]|uniref:Uncharacterized protein n=1 Tax=Brassica carinata TaxID=52824 RepID=A0A8X7VBI7_BRACI|nr:hypothetical protein Bca52824_027908 [Brassica carinata]